MNLIICVRASMSNHERESIYSTGSQTAHEAFDRGSTWCCSRLASRATQGTYFLFNTGSRFVLVEPHTHLPGVGYLPRSVQSIYVRLFRRSHYRVHLPSLWELRRWLKESPFSDNWKIIPSKQIDITHKQRTFSVYALYQSVLKG